MPTAPPRCCPCGGLKRNGVCDRCGKPKDYRPNSNERGYTSQWDKAKEHHLREYPLCVCCLAQGIVTGSRGRAGNRVDHIVPADMAPELFWEPSNYQTLCLDCDLRYKQPIEKRARTGEQVRVEWEAKLDELRKQCTLGI
jgi:5-methylcytosine-specific restriction protein A